MTRVEVTCLECGWTKIDDQRNEYICDKCPGFVIMKLRKPLIEEITKGSGMIIYKGVKENDEEKESERETKSC